MGSYGSTSVIKQKAGITASDLNNVDNPTQLDTLIENLKDRASGLVEEFCGRDFEEHTGQTVKLDGNGRREIRLPVYPIISISEVRVNGSVLNASDYRIKPADYPLGESDGRNPGILERKFSPWPDTGDFEEIEVDLDYGYTTPPGAIKGVVEDLVVDALLDASQSESLSGAQSASMDGFSITLSERMRLTAEHENLLADFVSLAKA